jgi:oligoribonuclease NrnB/cAMP/cGMP phosphodiesterase (DHH superfamily)
MSRKVLCIYHGNCDDGFGAAHAVYTKFQELDHMELTFHKGIYGEAPPLGLIDSDTTVYIVDFSYKNEVLVDIAAKADQVILIDHHLSFEQQMPWPVLPNLSIVFDMEHSGAWLTWNYLFPDDIPYYIEHIQDNDLWKFKLPQTKEFIAGLRSNQQKFSIWDELLYNPMAVLKYKEKGAVVLSYYNEKMENIISLCTRKMTINGIEGKVCNAPPMFASDIGNTLAKQTGTFGATYFHRADGAVVFSLRSIGEECNVANLAKLFGGGGHKNAAGFTLMESPDINLWNIPDSVEGE